MIIGLGEWHRLRMLLYKKRKCKKKRVNKRKTKIIMGGKWHDYKREYKDNL